MERRVNDLIGRMRPEEKLALVAHRGNERLGIPALKTVEGVMGISAKVTATAAVRAPPRPLNILLP